MVLCARCSTGVIVEAAVGHALLVVLGANVVWNGLRVLGNVGRETVLANAVILQG